MKKKKILLNVMCFLATGMGLAQAGIPEWFEVNMKQSIGTWTTDNTLYNGEHEPYDQYGMDWEWGIGRKSIKGTLYGIIKGKKQGVFWEFRQYWDHGKNQAMVVQYGPDGTLGSGPLTQADETHTELVQEFVNPQGHKTLHGHRSSMEPGKLITISFDISDGNAWKKRRSYTWYIRK